MLNFFTQPYFIHNDIIFFKYYFNGDLSYYTNIINNYKKLIIFDYDIQGYLDQHLEINVNTTSEILQKIFNVDEETMHITHNIGLDYLNKSKFNHIIKSIPPNITHLYLNSRYNCPIGNISKHLTHIIFGDKYNQLVDNLPQNLIEIYFGYSFNESVDNLPLSLIKITFGEKFNQLVNNLPQNLIEIYFGCDFNQTVNNLPTSLRIIHFDEKFNQSLEKLPNSITHIIINSENFDHSLNKLPLKLTKLEIKSKYKQDIILSENLIDFKYLKFKNTYTNNLIILVPNLTHLEFFDYYPNYLELPSTLKYIQLNYKCKFIEYLPASVEEVVLLFDIFTFYDHYTLLPSDRERLKNIAKKYEFKNFEFGNLPSSIKKLSIYGFSVNEIVTLPFFLEELCLGSCFNGKIINMPKNLKKITCDKYCIYIEKFIAHGCSLNKTSHFTPLKI